MSINNEIHTDPSIDIYKFISLTHRKEFHERRKYEWRVFFSTLGIYSSIIVGKFTTNAIPPKISPTFGFVFLICDFFIAISAIIYLALVNNATSLNKDFAHTAEDALMDLSPCKGDFKDIRMRSIGIYRIWWSLTWQTIIIILFAIITFYVVIYL